MPGKVNLTIRINADIDADLAQEAKRQDRSKAWITIKALQDYLSKREEK